MNNPRLREMAQNFGGGGGGGQGGGMPDISALMSDPSSTVGCQIALIDELLRSTGDP